MACSLLGLADHRKEPVHKLPEVGVLSPLLVGFEESCSVAYENSSECQDDVSQAIGRTK